MLQWSGGILLNRFLYYIFFDFDDDDADDAVVLRNLIVCLSLNNVWIQNAINAVKSCLSHITLSSDVFRICIHCLKLHSSFVETICICLKIMYTSILFYYSPKHR